MPFARRSGPTWFAQLRTPSTLRVILRDRPYGRAIGCADIFPAGGGPTVEIGCVVLHCATDGGIEGTAIRRLNRQGVGGESPLR
jgi:hypothetical protein